MKALQLEPRGGAGLRDRRAGAALRRAQPKGQPPAPVTAEQLIEARRPEDLGHSLWTTFQRVQENVIRGGQPGRSAQGRRMHTRRSAASTAA